MILGYHGLTRGGKRGKSENLHFAFLAGLREDKALATQYGCGKAVLTLTLTRELKDGRLGRSSMKGGGRSPPLGFSLEKRGGDRKGKKYALVVF